MPVMSGSCLLFEAQQFNSEQLLFFDWTASSASPTDFLTVTDTQLHQPIQLSLLLTKTFQPHVEPPHHYSLNHSAVI